MNTEDVQRAQAAREAATAAGGLYVEPEHMRALATYVERGPNGEAALMVVGYVAAFVMRWQRNGGDRRD